MRGQISKTVKAIALLFLFLFPILTCSNRVQSLLEEGASLEENGHYPEAIDKYAEALKKEPNNEEIHLRMAISYSSIDMLDEAAHHYQEALKINPDNLEAHLNYSGYWFKKRDFDAALTELATVITISPESREAEIAKSLVVRVEAAKIRSELISNLEEEIQAGSSDKDTLIKLGRAYIDEGQEYLAQDRQTLAVDEYKKAIQLLPENGEFHYLFAELYDGIGERDKAVEELELAAQLEPDNSKYKISLAGLYIQMEKIEEGKKLLENVLDSDPKSEEAEFAKRRLQDLEIKMKMEEEKKKAEKEDAETRKKVPER